jgi:hypothetical protein
MDGIVRYLSAVYPAAAPRLRTLGDAKLRALFESLDYYYACDPARSASYTRMPACAAVEALGLRSHELPPLPYVPPGTFYRVQEPIRLTESGSFTRFTKPVFLVSASRTTSASNFYSSWHARVGPAPSWTSPAAILRCLVTHGLGPVFDPREHHDRRSRPQRCPALFLTVLGRRSPPRRCLGSERAAPCRTWHARWRAYLDPAQSHVGSGATSPADCGQQCSVGCLSRSARRRLARGRAVRHRGSHSSVSSHVH